jgi:hypothetical protein
VHDFAFFEAWDFHLNKSVRNSMLGWLHPDGIENVTIIAAHRKLDFAKVRVINPKDVSELSNFSLFLLSRPADDQQLSTRRLCGQSDNHKSPKGASISK